MKLWNKVPSVLSLHRAALEAMNRCLCCEWLLEEVAGFKKERIIPLPNTRTLLGLGTRPVARYEEV